jgi:poly-D-alanine transfer protein DltD
MLSGFLRLHVIPFLGAALLVLAGGYVLVKFDVLDKVHGTERVISIGQNINSQRGRFPNLQNNDSLEAVLYSSLACQNQISIFGSSELTGTQFAPYHFLPDNVGIPCLAIGHAHHQSFSILAELLANQEVLKNSKICILLSLTWFETKGTNAEAFVEFVKPNMMNRILHNSKIQSKYLKHISNTISYLEDDLSGENAQMRAFKQQNLSSNDRVNAYLSLISREINVPLTLQKISYEGASCVSEPKKTPSFDFTLLKDSLKTSFIQSVSNNDYWVYDEYFSKHLVKENGSIRKGHLHEVSLSENTEWEDLNFS